MLVCLTFLTPWFSISSPSSFTFFLFSIHLVINNFIFVHHDYFDNIFIPSSSGHVTFSFVRLSGTLFGCGGRPGVPAAPSGRDGEAAHVWWCQCAWRGDHGDLITNMGQSWYPHAGKSPTLTAGSHPTATVAATGELSDDIHQCFQNPFLDYTII